MSERPTLHTWGYGKDGTWRDLIAAMNSVGHDKDEFVIVDVRESRGSRNRDWNFKDFGPQVRKGMYEWAHWLGNTTRKAGEWVPRDPVRAYQLTAYYRGRIDGGDNIVLVCAEADPMRPPLKGKYHPRTKCHRVLVAEAIAEFKTPRVEVIHL